METKEQLKQRITELEAKIKQVAEEFNKQHELLDQYELGCTDEVVRLKNIRIAELKEEVKNLTEVRDYWFNKDGQRLKELNELAGEKMKLENENAKLQEQLKNSIVPKYHLDQYVYVIRWGKPYLTRIDVIKAILINGKVEIFYEYDAPGSYAHVEIIEDGVFASEAEAQKYLEEHNG